MGKLISDSIKAHTQLKGNTNFKGRTVTGISLSVDGAEDIVNRFVALGEDAIFKLADPSTSAANIVADMAKTYAPKDDGDLIKGIVVRKPGKPKKSSHRAYQIYARVTLTKGARHGVPVELGHKMSGRYAGRLTRTGSDRVEPRPFLRPAADVTAGRVSTVIINAMDSIIKKEWGR